MILIIINSQVIQMMSNPFLFRAPYITHSLRYSALSHKFEIDAVIERMAIVVFISYSFVLVRNEKVGQEEWLFMVVMDIPFQNSQTFF